MSRYLVKSKSTIRAAGVTVNTPTDQAGDPGANPRAALHSPRRLIVSVIPVQLARDLIIRYHYLHSMPGGTEFCFGVFAGDLLEGIATVGVGPFNAHRLINGAKRHDGLTLTRLWLSDQLPRNSESRVLSILARQLRRHTEVRFLLSYADPAANHVGTIYQAAGWTYTGMTEPQPLMDLGDGIYRHLRSVGSAFGTHSAAYLRRRGLDVKMLVREGKHRYVLFVDPDSRHRLRVPVLPYPKKGE